METFANDMLTLLDEDYIGDDLTLEDLQNGHSAFLEDEKEEPRPTFALEMS